MINFWVKILIKNKFTFKLCFITLIISIFVLTDLSFSQGEVITNIDPSVTISDQKSDNQIVYVDQVISSGSGWITIHKDDGFGGIGTPIGYSSIIHGINVAIEVILTEIPIPGANYAMLHVDAGELNVYEFPGYDIPVRDKNDSIIVKTFLILNEHEPYVVVADQPIVNSIISVDLIVSNESDI